MVLGNRSQRGLLAGGRATSTEALLAMTTIHRPILIIHWPRDAQRNTHSAPYSIRTRAGFRYTGCFTCEFQIVLEATCVLPAVLGYEAKVEFLQM